jgi:hypothetical protein
MATRVVRLHVMGGVSRREPPVETRGRRRSAGGEAMAYARRSEFPFLASTYILVCTVGVVAATLLYFLA